MLYGINLIVPNVMQFNSFLYCAKMFRMWFSDQYNVIISSAPRFGYLNIRIDDLVLTIRRRARANIYWLDTPLDFDFTPAIYPDELYVTSRFNAELCEKVGLKARLVIPRLINPKFFIWSNTEDRDKRKDFDICIIGYYDKGIDRKNFRLAKRLIDELNLSYIAITNCPFLDNRYEFGKVSERKKYELIASSKWLLHIAFSGGFEMPVLEAMAIGVPVIYSDAPAHNEFAVGLPVTTYNHTLIDTRFGKMHKWEIDYESLEDTVKYAINIEPTKYVSLCTEARYKALDITRNALKKWERILKDFTESR